MIKVLDFWAEWCGPCKFMNPIIDELEEELKGKVEFEKIDVDKNQDKATKYQVCLFSTASKDQVFHLRHGSYMLLITVCPI